MASWLKVAEDLFEVVDRRAKLVVSELSEEQSNSHPSVASKGEDSQKGKKSKSSLRLQIAEPSKKSDTKQGKRVSASNDAIDTTVSEDGPTSESQGIMQSRNTDAPSDVSKDEEILVTLSPLPDSNDFIDDSASLIMEPSTNKNEVETSPFSLNSKVTSENTAELREGLFSAPLEATGTQFVNVHLSPGATTGSIVELAMDEDSLKIDQKRPANEIAESCDGEILQLIEVEVLQEPVPKTQQDQGNDSAAKSQQDLKNYSAAKTQQEQNNDSVAKTQQEQKNDSAAKTQQEQKSDSAAKTQQEQKVDISISKVQDQLDEVKDVLWLFLHEYTISSCKSCFIKTRKLKVAPYYGNDGALPPPLPAQPPLKERRGILVAGEVAELPLSSSNVREQGESIFDKPFSCWQAQGLLKSTVTTGQSKEARLARVCAGLSSRLQEYKYENAQLEELLIAERERSSSYEGHIKQLQQELSVSKSALNKVESNMSDALAAKNSEIKALVASMDAMKKKTAVSEGQLASLQANMETIMRSRELTETQMMQALLEELAAAELRSEEEHTAHNATKMAAMEREVELEHRVVEASSALARIQRMVDERTSRASELEQKLALLELECASLNQELQDMEACSRRGEKRSLEEANQALKMQAWQKEVERAHQGQRDAESKLASMEAELQKMRVEMAGMKRDAEHYSRQEHMELEKRYRELTDLLYYKQTQLEAMASEKATAEFQLEKEAKRLQEAQVEAERSRVSRRASSSWEDDADFKALEPLPLHHRHMVGASIQIQKAVKLIDSGAASATRFLWRYPIARVLLLFYLVFVHLFLMFLLHRLQEQADSFAAKEVAASMGLASSNLP
ncbi:golgin candidate 1-like [Aristolochia californica]|uniref:golgin candidate 1-like n=1 Tax=Aristolochia californica TaxID=171875 RepID=UPI0035DDC624